MCSPGGKKVMTPPTKTNVDLNETGRFLIDKKVERWDAGKEKKTTAG